MTTTSIASPRSTEPATEPQYRYLKDLLHSRVVAPEVAERLRQALALKSLDKALASRSIDWMKRQPRRDDVVTTACEADIPAAAPARARVTEPGVYEADGAIYRVRARKRDGRLYATVLTERGTGVTRLTEGGKVVHATYEFAPGAMRLLYADMAVTKERAAELTHVFTFCIRCSRHLKAAESVARSIGPVCWKAFA